MLNKGHAITGCCCGLLILILFVFPGQPEDLSSNLFSFMLQPNQSSTNLQAAEIGQTFTMSRIAVTATSVQVFTPSPADDAQPPAGDEYILVHIQIKNLSDSSYSYSPADFDLESASGAISTSEFMNLSSSGAYNSLLQSDILTSHSNAEGSVFFQCSLNTSQAQLIWNSHFPTSNATQEAWNIQL